MNYNKTDGNDNDQHHVLRNLHSNTSDTIHTYSIDTTTTNNNNNSNNSNNSNNKINNNNNKNKNHHSHFVKEDEFSRTTVSQHFIAGACAGLHCTPCLSILY